MIHKSTRYGLETRRTNVTKPNPITNVSRIDIVNTRLGRVHPNRIRILHALEIRIRMIERNKHIDIAKFVMKFRVLRKINDLR